MCLSLFQVDTISAILLRLIEWGAYVVQTAICDRCGIAGHWLARWPEEDSNAPDPSAKTAWNAERATSASQASSASATHGLDRLIQAPDEVPRPIKKRVSTPTAVEPIFVTGSSVRVRAGPGTQFEQLASFKRG